MITDKFSNRIMISLFVLIFITSFTGVVNAGSMTKAPSPVVYNGILDLEKWDAEKDGVIELTGTWDFYWDQLLTYHNLEKNALDPDLKASVPVVWNTYEIEGKPLPGFGCATYRIQVINAEKDTPFALKIPTMSTAYRMYLDDEMIASNGNVTAEKTQFVPENKPATAYIVPKKSQFNLIVQVANYAYARGGMWYSIKMGTPNQIQEMTRKTIYTDLFLIGSFFIMGLYYFSIFLLRREDKASLYFVLMCFVAMGRIMIHGDYAIYKVLPFINFKTVVILNYYTVYWGGTAFLLFLKELYPNEVSKYVIKATLAYSVSISILTLFLQLQYFTKFKPIMMTAVICAVFYGLICTGIAFYRKKENTHIVLFGACSIGVGALYDVLYHGQVINFGLGELTPIGFFIFIFSQSLILARRFSKAYDKANSLSKQLLQLDQLKDEFLANTSHELRTPLNGILGITEALIHESEGSLNDKQKESLSIISSSSRRLSNLVNEILDYSKMKHGDVNLNCRAININTVVKPTLAILKHTKNSANLEIMNTIDDELPCVFADENRFAQIIYNLIGNALKFTEKGYVKLSADLENDEIIFCIHDTGEGIPKEKYDDIFKSFEQLDTTVTRKHGGTGLGLSITKHLVELHKGKIWVDSVVGEGTKFFFTLPISREQVIEERQSIRSEIAPSKGLEEQYGTFKIHGTKEHILIVDDEILNLQSAAAILKIKGYTISAVNNGISALEKIEKMKDISLVILDVMMPEISGYEICRKIRENKSCSDLPVLMLTAKANTEDVVMGFESGANDYLSKPFEARELLARVETLVNLKESVAQARAAETAFLQAQIKPHFLFNALNTISNFCDIDPKRAEQLINALAKYLRNSFDFDNLEMFITIEKEMRLVSAYVEIEQARFGGSIKVVFDIDNSLKEEIPPLSIQPLVENAIHHGLRKKNGMGTVVISVRKVADEVRVFVKDDGIGIEDNILDKLLSEYKTGSVGLRNIDLRLRKLYGKGLHIESEINKGTTVLFTIFGGGESVDTSNHCG